MYFNFFLMDSTSNGLSPHILDILAIISILFGIFIIISKNPVISVLYLIGLFIAIAVYLVSINLHFIGIAYLLVYVGAVSILFLFILMLINIRISELLSDTSNSIPLATLITIIFVYPINRILPYKIDNIINFASDKINFATSQNWDGTLTDVSHITSIGNIMYTNYSIWLFITSIILLLAMVGAIVITISQSNINREMQQLEANVYSIFVLISSQIKFGILKVIFRKNLITELDMFIVSGIILLFDLYFEILPVEVLALSGFVLLLNIIISILPNKIISRFLIIIRDLLFILKNPRGIILESLLDIFTSSGLFNILKFSDKNNKLYFILFIGLISYFVSQAFSMIFLTIFLGLIYIYLSSFFIDLAIQTNSPYLSGFYFIVSMIFFIFGIWTIILVINILGIYLIKLLRKLWILIEGPYTNNFTPINRNSNGLGNNSSNNPDPNPNGNSNPTHNPNPRRNSEETSHDYPNPDYNPTPDNLNPSASEPTLNNTEPVAGYQYSSPHVWYPDYPMNENTNFNATSALNYQANPGNHTEEVLFTPVDEAALLEHRRMQNFNKGARERRAKETPAQRAIRLEKDRERVKERNRRRRGLIP